MRPTCVPSVLLVLFLPVLAAACASEPYEVSAPAVSLSKYGLGAAGTESDQGAGGAQPRSIAICYNSAFSEPAAVLARVREKCPGKGEILRVEQDTFWNNCSLSKPSRATFICVPGPTKPSKFK